MKRVLFFSALVFTTSVYAATETEGAKMSLRALIAPILQVSGKGFSVAECEKYKINWVDVIMMRKTAALTYTFKPGCDIEGTVYPAVFLPI